MHLEKKFVSSFIVACHSPCRMKLNSSSWWEWSWICDGAMQRCWFWTDTNTVVVSLTGLLSLLAAALSSCVQHHLLDDVQLLIQSGEVEVCALLRHCCKVWGHRNNWRCYYVSCLLFWLLIIFATKCYKLDMIPLLMPLYELTLLSTSSTRPQSDVE